MPRNHAVERFENLFPRRKFVRVAEPPASMVFEFLPALILFVVWKPKRLRVRHMNRHRHVQFPATFPNRIELRVVDFEQLARSITQIKAETLVFLEPRRAEAMPFLHLLPRP